MEYTRNTHCILPCSVTLCHSRSWMLLATGGVIHQAIVSLLCCTLHLSRGSTMRCQKHGSHHIPQITTVDIQSDGKHNFRTNSAVDKRQKKPSTDPSQALGILCMTSRPIESESGLDRAEFLLPTLDLFDTPLKREHDPWHFLCPGYNDKVDGLVPTQHSLETLISHVVLIAYHLIESNIVTKHRVRTWAEDMKPQSVNAHITLATQYDPRECVLSLSYSRRTNDQGSGTIDLQRLEQFGIDPSRLRGRVLKARTRPYDVHHFRPEKVNNATVNELFNMVFEGGGLVFSPAEAEDIAMSEHRSPSASPKQCSDEDFLKGQMLAGGSWSDVAVEILWGSKRHAGTKNSIKPFNWMILQFARQNMVPSDGSLLDLSPGAQSLP